MRTVSGVDDYAMMGEALKRLQETVTETFPDLLIIDGGKGHLAAARKVLEKPYKNAKKIPELIALAKDPDRAYLPEANLPVDLEDRKQSSLLLKRIRDEAHRFAIGYHRMLRDRELLQSPLQRVLGIGKKRRLELLRVFGSIEEIENASVDTIASMKGFNRKIAENLCQALRRRK
jgi:excinuclease ABC subunit C